MKCSSPLALNIGTQWELDSSHRTRNLQLTFAQIEGVEAANKAHPTPLIHKKATCRGWTSAWAKKPQTCEGGNSKMKIRTSGWADIPEDEHTAVAACSIPLALGISTMQELDSSHGAKILWLALASEEGGWTCEICTSGWADVQMGGYRQKEGLSRS